MAWGALPVAGDGVTLIQVLKDLRAAVVGRQAIVGGTAPTDWTSKPWTLPWDASAGLVANLRSKIQALIAVTTPPCFRNPASTTGGYYDWFTLASLLTLVHGTPTANWLTLTKCPSAAEIQELRDAIKLLLWLELPSVGAIAGTKRGTTEQGPDADYDTIWSAAKAAYPDSGTDSDGYGHYEGIGRRAGYSPNFDYYARIADRPCSTTFTKSAASCLLWRWSLPPILTGQIGYYKTASGVARFGTSLDGAALASANCGDPRQIVAIDPANWADGTSIVVWGDHASLDDIKPTIGGPGESSKGWRINDSYFVTVYVKPDWTYV